MGIPGTRYTLTRAWQIVICEPDWEGWKGLQAEFRIHRSGQLNPTQAWFLWCLDIPIEATLKQHHESRDRLKQKTERKDREAERWARSEKEKEESASLHHCYATMRQGIPIAQEEFIILERKSACKRLLLKYKLRKRIIKSILQPKMPPHGPIWNPHSVSTVDSWTLMVATSSYGGTLIVLAMGKDRLGVNRHHFRKLDTATPINCVR